jgi:hypothetical protein
MSLTVGELKKLLERCDDDYKVELNLNVYDKDSRPMYKSFKAEFADIGHSEKTFVLTTEEAVIR